MSEVVLTKRKIKPEKISKLKQWMRAVQERTDEAIETLQDEGVYTESVFLEETESGTYLVTYMEAADLEAAWEAFKASDHEIDIALKELMQECLEDPREYQTIEPVYHLANPER